MICRTKLLQSLTATGWSVAQTAAQLGLHVTTVNYHMRRLGIRRPTTSADGHSPPAVLAAEMESLRASARQLIRRPGPRAVRELLQIEARHRILREQLRAAIGEPEPSDTRGRSPARFGGDGSPHYTARR